MSLVGVVKQNDGSIAQLAFPGFEIVLDRFVGMETVDMKQIDRSIREMRCRVVERAAHERGECRELGAVILIQIGKDLVAVSSCVRVSGPGVHRITTRIESEALDGQAERGVGNARMSAQFYE